jgi:2'-5' RNA ligase
VESPGRQQARSLLDRLASEGAQRLRERGAAIDGILVRELREPGSDERHGVTIVCRPPREVAEAIGEVQRGLRQLEPDQYYYPGADLHLTLLEVRHSQPREAAESVATALLPHVERLTRGLPEARLDSPRVVFNENAAYLAFLPVDEELGRLRTTLRERAEEFGFSTVSRYVPVGAHLTFLRYLRPLHTESDRWIRALSECRLPPLEWRIDNAWLTWGPNWYGRRDAISEGKFMIQGGAPA